MATIAKEAAQAAAKAINAYLASGKRRGSMLEGARVETLEAIEGTTDHWLAHFQLRVPGAFTAYIFTVDHLGRARPEPGHRFSPQDLYPEQAEPVAQEGGVM